MRVFLQLSHQATNCEVVPQGGVEEGAGTNTQAIATIAALNISLSPSAKMHWLKARIVQIERSIWKRLYDHQVRMLAHDGRILQARRSIITKMAALRCCLTIIYGK